MGSQHTLIASFSTFVFRSDPFPNFWSSTNPDLNTVPYNTLSCTIVFL